jgi:anti-anti-sigma factor
VSWYLTLTRRVEGGSIVVSAAGRLGTAAAPELVAALLAAAEKGCRVVLDLAGVDYISSAGLHAIELAARRLHDRNATLVLRGADGATKLSLDVAGPLVNVSYSW